MVGDLQVVRVHGHAVHLGGPGALVLGDRPRRAVRGGRLDLHGLRLQPLLPRRREHSVEGTGCRGRHVVAVVVLGVLVHGGRAGTAGPAAQVRGHLGSGPAQGEGPQPGGRQLAAEPAGAPEQQVPVHRSMVVRKGSAPLVPYSVMPLFTRPVPGVDEHGAGLPGAQRGVREHHVCGSATGCGTHVHR